MPPRKRKSVEPDVVYVLREGERNPSLVYSLRSLSNLPHGKVWIAGYCPVWLDFDHVGCIPNQQVGRAWSNSTENLVEAASHPEVSETFYLFNDDFFIVDEVEGVPPMHRGSLDEHLAWAKSMGNGSYVRGLESTISVLRLAGVENPLSFDTHLPLPMTKTGVLDAAHLIATNGMYRPMIRSLYGNLAGIEAMAAYDPKVYGVVQERVSGDLPYVSTTTESFSVGAAGKLIRKLFPEPSIYERIARRQA